MRNMLKIFVAIRISQGICLAVFRLTVQRLNITLIKHIYKFIQSAEVHISLSFLILRTLLPASYNFWVYDDSICKSTEKTRWKFSCAPSRFLYEVSFFPLMMG